MSAPFFGIESDTLGGLRAAGAITFANARLALAQLPPPAHGADLNVDLGALDGGDSASAQVGPSFSIDPEMLETYSNVFDQHASEIESHSQTLMSNLQSLNFSS